MREQCTGLLCDVILAVCGIAFQGPELSQVALGLNFLPTLTLGFVSNLLKTVPFLK